MPIIPFIFHSHRMQRRSANLILNLLNLMVDARIPDLSVKQDADVTLGKVQEKFRLDLSEEQAEVRSTPSLSLSVSLCLSLWLSGSLWLCLFYPTHISTEAYIMSILFTPAHPPPTAHALVFAFPPPPPLPPALSPIPRILFLPPQANLRDVMDSSLKALGPVFNDVIHKFAMMTR